MARAQLFFLVLDIGSNSRAVNLSADKKSSHSYRAKRAARQEYNQSFVGRRFRMSHFFAFKLIFRSRRSLRLAPLRRIAALERFSNEGPLNSGVHEVQQDLLRPITSPPQTRTAPMGIPHSASEAFASAIASARKSVLFDKFSSPSNRKQATLERACIPRRLAPHSPIRLPRRDWCRTSSGSP
jgi:hypothetical protein